MTVDPADRANAPNRSSTRDEKSKRDDPAAPEKSPTARKDPAEASSDRKRKQGCDALGERFPEQCDAPIAEDAPPQAMPDDSAADAER